MMQVRRILGTASLLALLLMRPPFALGEPANDAVPPGEVRLTESQMKLIELATEPARIGTVSPELVLNGEVTADQSRTVEILPRASGIVRAVSGELGDRVQAGDTLAVIESSAITEAEAAYLTARSKAALAQAQAAREADLRRKRITSEQEYQVARQAADQAGVELRAAERKLALLGVEPDKLGNSSTGVPVRVPVTAPFAGTLIERRVAAGDQVTEATPLFRLANLDQVWVIASVFARDIGKVAVGQPASVTIEGYGDRRFEGKVTWISDVVDEKTRTLKIRVELANPDRILRPGSFARVSLTPRTDDVIAVPASAVQRQKDQAFVFVESGPGRFVKRDVGLGRRTRDRVEITRGLEAGEKVVTNGSFALRSELEKSAFAGGD
jgi:cobalt-zinc-cadmium efflux system membrane fusion protein